jgi:sugar/nucleoside kinase (ribokinase family)
MTTHGNDRKKVIGLGMACLDQLLVWEDAGLPVRDNRLVVCDWQGGGPAGTALVAVTRLGGEAEMWAAVGNDWIGDLILGGLAEEGVDTSQVRRIKGTRGPHMIVCVDQRTGERHFFHATGRTQTKRPVGDLGRLRGAGCLLVDGTRPPSDLRAAREARRLGVPVVADVGWWNEATPDILRHVDYAILSEPCARGLGTGTDWRAACRKIRALGPPCVVITLGAKGLVCLEGEAFRRLPAFRVNVVDTTGAGDVFHGAFCWGLVQGMPLAANLAFASAAAAMKCRHVGGRAGIPRRREVVRFLRDQKVAWSDG